MYLRSTKHGLAKSTRRFREATDVRTTGAFRGAIEPGFSDRISSHRLFLGTRVSKPIRLNFRQPGNPFKLIRWPRLRRTNPVHYVFSPTIQLTFPFNPVSNVFFETGTDSRFQWLLSEINKLRPAGETLAIGSHGGGFWNSLRQFRDYREELSPIRRKGALMLLNEERLAGTLARVIQSGSETSWSTPSPRLFTILHTPQVWTRTLNESLLHSDVQSGRGKPLRDGKVRKTEKMLVLLRPDFDLGGAAWDESSLRTSLNVKAVAPRQTFSMQLALPQARSGLASPGGSFANPSLTFAASQHVDATRRSQSFGPPTDLSYARRESPQLQGIVNALRDLRASQSEMRSPAAPQLPSIEQLTGQIRQQLERELRIEKERRGL